MSDLIARAIASKNSAQLASMAQSITPNGAKPNDPTFDNIGAIQATVNALHALGGGTVYFPPYNTYYIKPSATNFITLYDNVFIEGGVGSTIKVVNNAGDFNYLFYTNNPIHTKFTNLTFDLNVQNNPGCNIQTNTAAQSVIRFDNLAELKFTGCKVLNAGGTNSIICGGGNDTAFIEITNNYFQFVRGASTTSNYDVSVIYFDAFQAVVKDNRFVSDSVSLPNTAMEVHGDVLEVSGNYASYFNCGILPLVPVNSVKQNLMRWDFHDNHFDNMRNGVYIFVVNSGKYGSTITQFSNINIHHNSFRLNPAAYGTTAGSHALYFVNQLATNFIVDHLTFESNDIVYVTDTANGSRTETIICADDAINFSAGINYQNVIISDNRMTNVPSTGITFMNNTGITNILIRNNHATNVGCGILQQTNDSYKAFLRVSSVNSLTNVVLDNNYILDTGNPVNTCYFVSVYAYSIIATTSNMIIRANNRLLSSYGSIGCMPVWTGDDEARKSIFEWPRVQYLSSTTSPPNGVLLHQTDIVVTPTKVYSVNSDGATGSLQTAGGGTVTGTSSTSSNILTVNDASNITAGMFLKVTDGTNSFFPQVKYVWSPTQVVLANNATYAITNGTVTYNTVYFTDVYKSNKGTGTLLSGNTTLVIYHSLNVTPSSVTATPQGNVGNWWITSINSSNFTFNCTTAPGANTVISWEATV